MPSKKQRHESGQQAPPKCNRGQSQVLATIELLVKGIEEIRMQAVLEIGDRLTRVEECMGAAPVAVPSSPSQSTQGDLDMEATSVDPVLSLLKCSAGRVALIESGGAPPAPVVSAADQSDQSPGNSSPPQEPPQEAAWADMLQLASMAAQELGNMQQAGAGFGGPSYFSRQAGSGRSKAGWGMACGCMVPGDEGRTWRHSACLVTTFWHRLECVARGRFWEGLP